MVNRVWLHHFGAADRRHAERLRHPERPADRIPNCSTASPPRSSRAAGRSSAASADPALEHLPAGRAAIAPSASQVDPENLLLWRQNRRRLELEPMRDAMLAVAGRLDPSHRRPARRARRPIPEGRGGRVYSIDRPHRSSTASTGPSTSPAPTPPAPSGPSTTVPQQALFLMNSPFVAEQARDLARRVAGESASDDADARIDRLYRLLFGRRPASGASWSSAAGSSPRRPGGPIGADRPPGRRLRGLRRDHGPGHSTSPPSPTGPASPGSSARRSRIPTAHYLHLKATGGPRRRSERSAAIRRWVAPGDAMIRHRGHASPTAARGGRRPRPDRRRRGRPARRVDRPRRPGQDGRRALRGRGRRDDRLRRRLPDRPLARLASIGPRSSGSSPPTARSPRWDARADFAGPPPEPPIAGGAVRPGPLDDQRIHVRRLIDDRPSRRPRLQRRTTRCPTTDPSPPTAPSPAARCSAAPAWASAPWPWAA